MPETFIAPEGIQRLIAVETFANGDPWEPTSSDIRVRALPGQGAPDHWRVECSKSMRSSYPVGTVFLITSRVITREGTPLLYSHFKWPFQTVEREKAEELIASQTIGFFAGVRRK